LKKAVSGPGQAANDAKQKKTDKYADQLTQYQFMPIANETLGPINDKAAAFFQSLGRRMAAMTRE
jgi:hypothetical protein